MTMTTPTECTKTYSDLFNVAFLLSPGVFKLENENAETLSSMKSRLADQQAWKKILSMPTPFVANSMGSLKPIPTAVQLTILHHLKVVELVKLMHVSRSFKTIASLDAVWKEPADALGLSKEEILKGNGFKGAVKQAYFVFYCALYRDLTKTYQRVASQESELREVDIKKLFSHSEGLQKMKECLAIGGKYFAKFSWLQLKEPNLAYLPGWIWTFFPNVKTLYLHKSRIRSVPPEMSHIRLVSEPSEKNASTRNYPMQRSSGSRIRFLEGDVYQKFVANPEHFEESMV